MNLKNLQAHREHNEHEHRTHAVVDDRDHDTTSRLDFARHSAATSAILVAVLASVMAQ